MDIDRFITQDILEFLGAEQEKDIAIKGVRADEMTLFDIDKDYVRLITEQLKLNNLPSAKDFFDELRNIYNRTSEKYSLRKKMFMILKDSYKVLESYLSLHQVDTAIDHEFSHYAGIFSSEMLPKKILSELEEVQAEVGEQPTASDESYNLLQDSLLKGKDAKADSGEAVKNLAEMMAHEIAQAIPLEESKEIAYIFGDSSGKDVFFVDGAAEPHQEYEGLPTPKVVQQGPAFSDSTRDQVRSPIQAPLQGLPQSSGTPQVIHQAVGAQAIGQQSVQQQAVAPRIMRDGQATGGVSKEEMRFMMERFKQEIGQRHDERGMSPHQAGAVSAPAYPTLDPGRTFVAVQQQPMNTSSSPTSSSPTSSSPTSSSPTSSSPTSSSSIPSSSGTPSSSLSPLQHPGEYSAMPHNAPPALGASTSSFQSPVPSPAQASFSSTAVKDASAVQSWEQPPSVSTIGEGMSQAVPLPQFKVTINVPDFNTLAGESLVRDIRSPADETGMPQVIMPTVRQGSRKMDVLLEEKARLEKERILLAEQDEAFRSRLEEVKNVKLTPEEIELIGRKEEKEKELALITLISQAKKDTYRSLVKKELDAAKDGYRRIKEAYDRLPASSAKRDMRMGIIELYDQVALAAKSQKRAAEYEERKAEAARNDILTTRAILANIKTSLASVKASVVRGNMTQASRDLAEARELSEGIPDEAARSHAITTIETYQARLASLTGTIVSAAKDDFMYRRGLQLLLSKRKNEAADVFREILSKNPSNIKARLRLMEAQAEAN